MTDFPTIRRATVDDAARLASAGARWFRETFGAENDPKDMVIYLEKAFGVRQQTEQLADPARLCLVAEEGEDLVGYALLRGTKPGAAPAGVVAEGPSLEVERFYVSRAWHGRGLASRLMEEVLHFAWALGARTVWLAVWERNHRAMRFYEKLGYREVGEQEFVLGTDRQRDLLLALPVPETRQAPGGPKDSP